MSFLNEYNSEITGIVFEDPLDKVINDAFDKALSGGGTSGTTSAPSTDVESWLATFSPTQLRYAWRAGLINEDEWQQELLSRGETSASARAEIEKQKSTGLSTAASTRGQLTAAEQAGVDALKKIGSIPGRPQTTLSPDEEMALQAAATPGSAATGSRGAVGPGGRTFDQVTGTDYVNDAEHQWYLSQARSGGGSGSTASASGGASSGGGGSSSSGGGRMATTTGKDDPGSTFTVRGANGETYHWREYTRGDGTSYYRNLETNETQDLLPRAVAEKPQKKQSPLEQAAASLQGARGLLAGGEQAAADSGQVGASSPADAPASPGEPRVMMADQGRRVAGLDMPGYGTLNTVGTGGNNVTDILGAAHVRSSGDPSTDLRTVLGILGQRELALAQNPGLSPAEYQSQVDRLAWDKAYPTGGGYPNYNTGFDGTAGVSTGAHNASGRLVIDDTPGHYRELLDPTLDPNAYAKGGGFNTSAPLGFMNMVTGEMEGMAGGTGKEKITVEPVGPHGSPRMEAMVGSRMWPSMMGMKPYANGTEDQPDPLSYTAQMPRTGDPDVVGSQGPDFGGTFPGTPAHDKIDFPYTYPMNPYMEDLILGPLLEKQLKRAGFPGTTASLLNAPDEVRSRILGPRALAYVNARATPGHFHDSMGPMYDWLGSYFSALPQNGRAMYQADGGTNYAGMRFTNDPSRMGASSMGEGMFVNGRPTQSAWDMLTPQQMWNLWDRDPMGIAPVIFGFREAAPRTLQYDGNLAPTPFGTYAELQPNVYKPPANFAAYANTPVNQVGPGGVVTQRSGPPTGAKGPVTLADGGMGAAGMMGGGMMPDPSMQGPMNMRQTDPMLLQALSAGLNKRIKMTLPVAA